MGDLLGDEVGVLVGTLVLPGGYIGVLVGALVTPAASDRRLESVGDTVSSDLGRVSLAAEGATAYSLLLV